jgi:nitrogen fixation/metabolism regulation signal transduction histidine kinase
LEFDRVVRIVLDPDALAVRALERLGEDASKLEVETEVETIVGDPTLLGRALANLLSNARGAKAKDSDKTAVKASQERGGLFSRLMTKR